MRVAIHYINTQTLDEKKLKAFFEGKLNSEESEDIKSRLSESTDHENMDKLFEDQWNESKDYASKEIFADVLYSEIESNLQTTQSLKKQHPLKFIILKYAASIAVLIAGFVFLYQNLNTKSAPVSDVEIIQKITTSGQKSTIMLSDGSKVTLNSASVIKYPKQFSVNSRTIQLDGEAFFEVAKDQSRPFTVIANQVSTTALGTSFNIKSSVKGLKVSLATGKVVVSNAKSKRDKKYFLTSGEAVSFNHSDGRVLQSTFDFKKDLLWKEGVLYFDNAEFNEMMQKLESWYGVSIEVQERPSQIKKYTGQFNNESLSNVLQNMGFALSFDYFLNEKKATLIFNDKE